MKPLIQVPFKQVPEKAQALAKALSVPKIITVLCLLALGVNGLVQAGLQRDMTRKAQQLSQQVATSQELSTQMKQGLNGLGDLQAASARMEETLRQLQAETSGMNGELATLDKTVSGIHSTVTALGSSTQATGETIAAVQKAAEELLGVLKQVGEVNGGMIANLNQMIGDQQAIIQQLAEMNRKTALLPQWGGGQ
ncbi:MAG: hypothetical protein WCC10_03580 [Tumebacillaceae bacterium]